MTDLSRAVIAESPVSRTVTGIKMKCSDMKMPFFFKPLATAR